MSEPPVDGPASHPLSVLVVSHVADVWGAQYRLLDLAPRLAAEGIELTLAAPATGDLPEAWDDLGLPRVTLELSSHVGLRWPGTRRRPSPPALAAEVRAVGRCIGRIARLGRRFQVLHSHTLWSHLEVAAAGRLTGVASVLDLHDFISPGLGRRLLRLASGLASATIANSSATAATVGGPGRSGVHVVHPGVDLDRFRPGPADPAVRAVLSGSPPDPLVGIIGRLDPKKGVDVVVQAVARLRGALSSTRLVVVGREYVGSAAYAEQLRRDAAAALGDRVRFLGPRDDVPDLLRAVDVLVNASYHEPFGRTVLEAHACRTPVVATNAGGIPDFVVDGRTGLLVPPGDPGALARALETLLADPALQDRLATAGRNQVEERFSVVAQSRAVADVYRRVAARAAKRRPVPSGGPPPPSRER